MIKTVYCFLFFIGIIGSLFVFFTKSYEQFGSVFGRCIGCATFLWVIDSFINCAS